MAKQYGMVYIKRNKTKPNELGHWNEKKKLEAVTTYLATGNLALTSRIINVPDVTVRSWFNADWWKDLVAETQTGQDLKLNKSLEKIVDKSLAAVNDILENGDYHYDQKQGKVVRVPAKLKDVTKVTTDLIDKQMILRKQHVHVSQSAESTQDRLLKLAEAFAEFALNKPKNEEIVRDVIEGDFEHLPPNFKEALQENTDALHDQREEGLQEGDGLGPQSQDSKEGQGSSEQSESKGG